MRNLFTCFSNFWSNILGSESRQLGLISEEAAIEQPLSTHSAPFGTRWKPAGNLHTQTRCLVAIILLALLCVPMSLKADHVTLYWSNDDDTSTQKNFTATSGSVTGVLSFSSAKNSSANAPAYNSTYEQLRCYYASNGSGGSITITAADGITFTAFEVGSATQPTTKYSVDNGSATAISFTQTKDDYFGNLYYGGADELSCSKIKIQNCNTTNTQLQIYYIYIEYSAASCSADPSIGAASLSGTFNLSTVGVQCASITPGTDCSVASGDYGFIWYERDGTKKEIGGTGVTKVAVTSGAYSSGSFSKDLTGSFTLGTRYSVRAFATNGKPATAYSDTITFQPRSVTFNLNGHGSSTPTTQYVNNGEKASNPSYSESVTGYTFGGWFKEAGCSNEWTFGTDVVSGENKTLYAKWTAKNYTITLDQDLTPTTAGTTSIAVTYNASTNLTSAITKPTATGWTFAGYYTAKNGGGTQIIDVDGNVLASKAGYTDASKNWIGTSDVTLYAKWTCTVTWSVNGLTNVYSAHTLTYNGTSTKVASIPGPPSPASYCGDKFVGWTSVENYVHGTSNLFTNVAGSPELKTVGNTTFYAVFADYDDED